MNDEQINKSIEATNSPTAKRIEELEAEVARLREDNQKMLLTIETVVLALFGDNPAAPTDSKSLAETIIGLKAEVARLRGKKMLVSVKTGATTTISEDAMICPDCGTALLHQPRRRA